MLPFILNTHQSKPEVYLLEFFTLRNERRSVSKFILGCEALGGTDWGQIDVQAVMDTVAFAFQAGITAFDTADVYGLGLSETRLGDALGVHRHEAFIITKFGVNWREDRSRGRAQTFRDSSPKYVVSALENSLKRLRVDSIPLYLIHWPDPNTPIEHTMEALLRCQELGKVQHIGVSNFSLAQIQQAHQILPLSAIEFQYSFIDRRLEQEILPWCRRENIAVLTYGTLAQGLLTGKFDPNRQFSADDRRSRLPHFQGSEFLGALELVNKVDNIAKTLDKSPALVAMRWVLDHWDKIGIVVGAKSPKQVEENLRVFGWSLPAESYQQLTLYSNNYLRSI